MHFNDIQIQRYSRHLILPEIGLEGQKKISSASVLCVGIGGLGSPAAIYLASAGVGTLGIVDFDCVDITNLQRQILHTTENIGIPKTDSASKTLKALNPEVNVELHRTRLSIENAEKIIGKYDVVLDCSDNFPTRYLLNDICVALKKPLVYGSVLQYEGHATVFLPHSDSPCYRCLYPEPPPPQAVPSCAEAGVFCVVPGIIGLIQANEALKLILGIGSLLTGRLLIFNSLEMKFRELKIKRDPECPVCGDKKKITNKKDYGEVCSTQSETPAFKQISEFQSVLQEPANTLCHAFDEISSEEFKKLIASRAVDFQILDVRESEEITTESLPNSIKIPLSSLEKRLNELNLNATYYVVCQFGIRSKIAVEILKSHGFKNVKNLSGGLVSLERKK